MIRPARLREADAVRVLVRDAYGRWVARLGCEPGPMRDDYAQRIAAGQVWVLEVSGEIVGEVQLYTHVLMIENIALYEHLGFREIGRIHEQGFDRVYMTNQYVLLHASESQLRQRRSDDATRSRRNFEKHLAIIAPQRRYFETLNDAAPGRVLFLETTARDNLVPAVRDDVATLGSSRKDGPQLLERLLLWLHTQRARERR